MTTINPNRSAVVVVVDSLGAGFLGPQGNTWLDTPALNRLATESLLFEFAQTDSPRLDRVYRSYWQGRHAADLRSSDDCLLAKLAEANIETTLLTDEPQVAQADRASRFSDNVLLAPTLSRRAAGDISETQLAQIFAPALERIEQIESPSLLWIHAQGMTGRWDAPLEMRNQFADEDDPLPPEFVEPPNVRLAADHDPDEVLGYTHAYAGQVTLLDQCIGAVLDALSVSAASQETLLIFTSPRGFPLGQHGRVGTCDEALYGELVHVPLLIRRPDLTDATVRSHNFVQPPDIYATLLDWFGRVHRDAPSASSLISEVRHDAPYKTRDRALSVVDDSRALRTPAWFFHQTADQNELYAKPDDRWEANEVSARCAEVVELAIEATDALQQTLNTDNQELPLLPEVLVEGLE